METSKNITVIEGPQDVLSRDYPALFSYGGVHYCSTRQFVAVKKAQLFRDMNAVHRIQGASDSDEVASLSKSITGFDEANWRRHLSGYAWTAEGAKFGQNPAMAEALLATGDTKIVVANSPNGSWGVTQSASSPDIWDETKWRGENVGGKALMAARDMLRKQLNPEPTTRLDNHPEPVPLAHKIDISASWFAGYCIIMPRESWLPEMLAMPRDELVQALRHYMAETRVDATGGDPDSNVFLAWAEQDLGIDLREQASFD